MKLAFCAIIKGTDEEALLMESLIRNVKPAVDKIFITLTQKNKLAEDLCKQYGVELSHFKWNNNFASARNFNFSQVPKDYDYIMWGDADDQFRGLKTLKDTLEENSSIDTFSMNYLYHFNEYKQPDVVHMKTQIVKNDGCVEWVGALHEDFKENRQLSSYFLKDIERLHLSPNERIDRAKLRNKQIAQEGVIFNPEDPRSYWNLGQSLMGNGDYKDAKEAFKTFISLSHSDEEKYLVYINLSKIEDMFKNKDKSIEYARNAIGLKPEYPDAYHNLGQIYFNNAKYRDAETNILLGLTKRPPYYSIIVYNPRDYDFTPLMLLSKTYFQLSRPDNALICLRKCLEIQPKNEQVKQMINLLEEDTIKFDKVIEIIKKVKESTTKEEIKTLLDSVPEELRSHPGICNLRNIHFVKETSAGKDLVYYCGFTEEEWTPETARTKGIGGSEEAVIWLTSMFAKDGWNVTVYNNCGHKTQVFDGVTYKPFWEWNYRDKQDVVIGWRNPAVFQYEINAPIRLLDMHDVVPVGEFTEERVKNMTKVMYKSHYQADLYPMVQKDKVVIVPNGINASLFDVKVERDNNLIINTSAPNRGIFALTHMFKEIKKQHPEARLQWAYGWTTFSNGFRENQKVMEWKEQLEKDMKEIGVEVLGRLSHGDVANLYLKAGIWAYPSGFGEIDCISLSKAMGAGAYPVTTDFAALGEKQGHGGTFVHSDMTSNNWLKPDQHDFSIIDPKQIAESVKAIVKYLKNPPTEKERDSMRKWAQETYDWKRIYNVWEKNV